MFLSYAAVEVFTFAILLNIFYLYSPVESDATGLIYQGCEDCLQSECHVKRNRPCSKRVDPEYKFVLVTCHTCDPANGNEQFYSKDECNKVCPPLKMCACDGLCYMCIIEECTDLTTFRNCTVQDQVGLEECV
ncbi:unnamed protein product [Macrosiphum euphorbiae]|uniref:Protease inhibitor n=1 Tax=Macrosiphum euphorbiae TaxID=13131 RepID=A0AAV0XQE2_9HEMI|nr:unnamed protein product [Macrosiphum euphorbiae]